MYYIYILYTTTLNLYYVGYTYNIDRRLIEHNSQEHFNTFTSKHRPWILKALFACSNVETEPLEVERFIKSRKVEN